MLLPFSDVYLTAQSSVPQLPIKRAAIIAIVNALSNRFQVVTSAECKTVNDFLIGFYFSRVDPYTTPLGA